MLKNTKKIIFITGTRADFSKIKSLMLKVHHSSKYELFIFATGMHMSRNFGLTVKEIEKCGFKNIHKFINHDRYYQMDKALAATIDGFSKFVHEIEPDLIVVHGDRIEPLAGAIVGALNNILVAHIEGGELSGTIDDSLRHSITKLAHIHLVNDEQAKKRLIQMGENKDSIFVIGSPDLELLNSSVSLEKVKKYYGITYKNYAIVMFHPVTTELTSMHAQAKELVNALKNSGKNYIIIYPNNDLGFELIMDNYKDLRELPNFKLFPSLKFEFFISLLKHSNFIIGNSSCILKEALYLGISGILVGSRQSRRNGEDEVQCVEANELEILNAIGNLKPKSSTKTIEVLNSSQKFFDLLDSGVLFNISKQKEFRDIRV